MEGRCVDVVFEWSCPTVRSAVATVVLRRHGADVRGMITAAAGAVVRQQDADPHVGGASAAVEAGRSPEIGGGRDPFPGTGITNLQDLSLDQGAAPGLMRESKRSHGCQV